MTKVAILCVWKVKIHNGKQKKAFWGVHQMWSARSHRVILTGPLQWHAEARIVHYQPKNEDKKTKKGWQTLIIWWRCRWLHIFLYFFVQDPLFLFHIFIANKNEWKTNLWTITTYDTPTMLHIMWQDSTYKGIYKLNRKWILFASFFFFTILYFFL